MAFLSEDDLVECFCAYKNCYDQIRVMIEDSSIMVDQGTFGSVFRDFEDDLKDLLRDYNIGSLKGRMLLKEVMALVEVIKTEIVYIEAVTILGVLMPLCVLLQEEDNVNFSRIALLKG